jgi:hypothetical protein
LPKQIRGKNKKPAEENLYGPGLSADMVGEIYFAD